MFKLKPAVFLVAIFVVWIVPTGHAQSPGRIEMSAKRFTYGPDSLPLKKGEPVILVLHSVDVTHGLKIDAFNVKSDDIKKNKASGSSRPDSRQWFVRGTSYSGRKGRYEAAKALPPSEQRFYGRNRIVAGG